MPAKQENGVEKQTAIQQRSEVFGEEFAVRFFVKRGGHSEAHLKLVEVAAIAAFGYQMGASKEGSELLKKQRAELVEAIKKVSAVIRRCESNADGSITLSVSQQVVIEDALRAGGGE